LIIGPSLAGFQEVSPDPEISLILAAVFCMFVGHMAVAFAAKARAPRASLGAFVASAFALDLLWPLFLLAGIERVRIDPGNTKFTPLAFDCYPWSHSLLMAVLWGLGGFALVRLWNWDRQTQVLVFLLVVSHWVLDFVSHRPDLPLWPGDSPLFGLGLWNSVGATLVLEGALLAAGIALYLRNTTAVDRVGSIGFWLLISFSTLVWQASLGPRLHPVLVSWRGSALVRGCYQCGPDGQTITVWCDQRSEMDQIPGDDSPYEDRHIAIG
jgi:hypothetical protein